QNLTTYDYGFRIYNPGIARFLSVDPLTSDYPSWTPYAFAMNRPIDGIDLDGLEYVNSTTGEYDPYPNGAYDGDVHDDFYDTKAKNHQNHQQDLIDKGFLPSAPLVTITDERPAPAKVDPSTIQSTSNGNYFSSTSGISHYFNDNTSIGNSTTYLWSGEKWDLIRSEQQQYKNNLITVDAFINALANFTVGAISLFDFGISPGTLTGFRASYVASAAAKGVTRSLDDLSSIKGATWDEAKSLIPKDWISGPMKKGEGTKFVNPAKKGEQILLEKGWPGAKDPLHEGPYMKISRDGQIIRIPLQGNPTLK
ncbi:MAG TPA: RHS repeat-associated core domain-containing protein, partial [Saprospiraceae bacterium]|nr:RHS repeat-associated core domain-containing protein [Saprospiraceae bacterium]